MKNLLTILLISFIVTFVSCKKDNAKEADPIVNTDKIAPEGFNFKTSKDIDVDITLNANNNQPLSGVVVSIY
ncbi:MAG: hypothetical protein EOO01_20535, partial [Chitinophagaceae bacterium]